MSGLSSEMQIKEELLVRVIHLPRLKQPTLIPFGYAKWPREVTIEGSQSGFQTILDICDYTTTNRIKWGRASECDLWKGVSSILSQESELLIKKKVIGCPVWKTRNSNINVTNEMAEPVSLKKNQKGSVGLLPYQLNPKLRKYTQKKAVAQFTTMTKKWLTTSESLEKPWSVCMISSATSFQFRFLLICACYLKQK